LTSFDRALDPECFARPEVILYRLARTRYADLTGIGAALAPGRWNRSGQRALYASLEVGLPVLERLAHSPKDLIPSNLSLMKIQITGEWIALNDRVTDRETGAVFAFCPTLELATLKFKQEEFPFGDTPKPFAVAVPSVIVPAWNVVLYPEAHGFSVHVSLQEVSPFQFDPRLFTEDAAAEDIQ
jgi:RES domain-containing protein